MEERENKPDSIIFPEKAQGFKPDKTKAFKNKDTKRKQDTTIKKQISSKKNEGKPFILPPPKIESRQVKNEARKSKEKSQRNLESKEANKTQKGGAKEKLSEKPGARGKGNTSYMFTPFSPMLSWSPSFPSKNLSGMTQFFLKGMSASKAVEDIDSNLVQMNLQDFYTVNPKENLSPLGESSTSSSDVMAEDYKINSIGPEKTSMLENEFLLKLKGAADKSKKPGEILDEQNPVPKRSSFFEVELSSDVESDSQDYIVAPTEEELPLVEKFLSMLAESSSEDVLPLIFSDHTLSQQDEAFSLLSNLNSKQEESTVENLLYDDGSSTMNESSSLDESSQTMEYSGGNDDTILDTDGFAPYKGEFSALLEKAYSILDREENDAAGLQENQALLQPFKMQENFLSLLQEAEKSDSNEKLDKVSILLETFSNILNSKNEESSSSVEERITEDAYPASSRDDFFTKEPESDCQDSSCFSSLENPKTAESVGIYEEESSSADKCFLDFEESSSHPEAYYGDCEETSSDQTESTCESSCLQDVFDRELLNEETSEEDLYLETPIEKCPSKVHLPTVKVPVLVGKLNLDVDIFDIFPIHTPIKNITKLEWSIPSLETHVVLPASIIFFKGTLIAEIEYVNVKDIASLHTVKVPVKWEKTVNANWIYPPVMPVASSQKEYTFKTDDDQGISSHFESAQYFAENIEAQLQSINFVWHNSLIENEKPELDIQGRAILEMDLLQKQYVDLNLDKNEY